MYVNEAPAWICALMLQPLLDRRYIGQSYSMSTKAISELDTAIDALAQALTAANFKERTEREIEDKKLQLEGKTPKKLIDPVAQTQLGTAEAKQAEKAMDEVLKSGRI